MSDELLSGGVDLITTIIDIINKLCINLFSSIDKNIFPLLDELVFIDNNILETGDKMNKLLSNSPTNGVLILANCLFTAFVLYYAARLIIAHLTASNFETPSKFFMRAFLSGIAMNYSLSICKFLINSTTLISNFFCSLGSNLFGKEISFVTLTSMLSETVSESFNVFSLDGILSRYAFNFIICFNNKFCL